MDIGLGGRDTSSASLSVSVSIIEQFSMTGLFHEAVVGATRLTSM
jgi:hypothetical protein